MRANRNPKRERQPWTGSAKQDAALPTRPLKRAGAALVGLLLLAAFTYLVWHVIRPAPRLIAATWTVGDYDLLSAPPLPFARQSLAHFRQLVSDDSIARDSATSQTDEELLAFCKELAQYRGGSRNDLLVAFVIAHGVSVVEPARDVGNSNGDRSADAARRAVPYLLCSNYQPAQAGDDLVAATGAAPNGMVPLDTLIDALAACPVGHKLLLLDCGSVESDPGLGMVVNEFPKLLAEKVAAIGDANLCVLVSHGVGQRSLADQAEKSSIFARCVNQAWAEHARQQETRERSLVEFVDELALKIEESAKQLTDATVSQQPIVLWQGDGRLRQSMVQLPRIPKQPATEGEPADESPAASSAAAQARLALNDESGLAIAQVADPAAAPPAPADSKPSSQPQPAGQRPSAETAVPVAPPPASESPAATVDPKRGGEQAASAADNQPPRQAKPKGEKEKPARASESKNLWISRWAECDRRLTGDESGWTPIDFAPEAWRDYCERLIAAERRGGFGVAVSSAALDEPAWDEMAAAFRQQAARYEQHEDILHAVRLRNELLFRLPYHFSWMTSGASPIGDDEFDTLFPSRLFDNLAALIQTLAAPPRRGGAEAAAEVARWRAELRQHVANLEPSQQKLENRLSDEITALTHPKRTSTEGGDLPRITNLFGTPLLTASERLKLHQAIAKKLPRTAGSNRPANLWRRAELQWWLWRVAASAKPAADSESDAPQAAPPNGDFGTRLGDLVRQAPSSGPDSVLADGALRQELWALGNLQREAYQALENDLFTLARSTDDAARLADATLRLIDGRRAGHILKRSDYDPIDPVNRPLLPDLGIKHPIGLVRRLPRGGQALTLEIGKPFTLAWSVSYERPGARKLSWWVSYEDAAADVKLSFDGRPLSSGQRHELTFEPDELKKELRCSAEPRREADRGPIEVTLHVAAADAQAVTDAVAIGLPRRQPLRLDVAPRAGAVASSLQRATLINLRPFFSPQPPDEPRPTRFRLSLANDAPLAKLVTYQWFAPADEETLRRAKDGEDIAARCRRLAGTEKPVGVPAGGELALDLPFPKPPAPLPGAANPAPVEASPPGPAGHEIAAGLVLDVVEVEVKAEGAAPVAKQQQRFVIQIEPKRPNEYLAPPTVLYLPSEQRLSITVEPIEAGDLPPEGSKIVWEIEDKRLKTAADKKTIAKLSPQNTADTMYARLPPKSDETVEVQLTVDGYPRAFSYDVECDEVAHAPSQNKLEYLKNVEMQIARDKSASANERIAGALVFGNVPSLQVRLQADAPRDWFARPNHRIEVGIETSDGPTIEPTSFSADRLVNIRASAGTAPGDWEILATVRDIELTLDTEGRADSRFDVVARLMPEPIDQRRTVILDGLAPELRGLEAEVTADSISASVRARETSGAESGVDRVEFAVLKSGDWRNIKDAAAWPKAAHGEPAILGADGRWSVELKRPPEPGNYVVLARAIDNATNESEVRDYPLAIAKPSTAKTGDGKNSLIGSFTVRGARPDPSANWRVSLKGPRNVGPISANTGSYSFKGLPPGKYELRITGDFGKTETWGPREVTIEAPPAKATVDRWDLGSDDGQAR